MKTGFLKKIYLTPTINAPQNNWLNFFVALFVAFFSTAVQAIAAEKPPQVPHFSKYNFSTKVENSNEVILQHFAERKFGGYIFYRWDPVAGKAISLPLPQNLSSHKIIKTKQGYYFFGALAINEGKYKPEAPRFSPRIPAVAFLDLDGKVLTAKLPQYLTDDEFAHLAVLADQSVIMAGGNRDEKSLNTMFKLSIANTQLKVEQLPNLPFTKERWGYSLVGLADGRAMVLGGETYNAIGCNQCLNETYFFDPKTKKWQHGPNMLERRNEATATLLQNGNVLVVGGWTPTTSENSGQWGTVSPTSEIWDTKTNKFVAGGQLIDGTTMHQVTWLAGQEGKQLLIAGGKSSIVQLYDVEQNKARVIATLDESQSDYRSPRQPMTFIYNGQHYVWLNVTSSSAEIVKRWHLAAIPLPKNGVEPVENIDVKQGVVLNLYGIHFYPGEANEPSYIVGGKASDRSKELNLKRAIWPDGRMQMVDSIPTKVVDTVDLSQLPPLNNPRQDSSAKEVVTKQLADGRVIVAGGMVQANKIAVVDENSMNVDGQDTYLSVGASKPAQQYEIYDSKTKQWQDSAPSTMAGTKATILNDGRVLMIGKIEGEASKMDCINKRVAEDKCTRTIIEMSDTAGKAWKRVDLNSIPLVDIGEDETRLFVIQDELFLAGNHIVVLAPERYGTTDVTLWYNTQTANWETLWESKEVDSYRLHAGRIIFRQLANGKRVVLPVHGFVQE